MIGARALLLAATLALCGCVTPGGAPPPTLPAGQWGGDQVALTVAADGSGLIELSCASADFTGPAKLDVGGHFLVPGHYAPGGGPVRRDPPPPLPAAISGRLDADGSLWLDIAVRDSYPVRSAHLARGADPHLMRCL